MSFAVVSVARLAGFHYWRRRHRPLDITRGRKGDTSPLPTCPLCLSLAGCVLRLEARHVYRRRKGAWGWLHERARKALRTAHSHCCRGGVSSSFFLRRWGEEKGSICVVFSLPTPAGSSLRTITLSTFIGLSAVADGGGRPVVYAAGHRVKKHQGREGRQGGRAKSLSFLILVHVLRAI